MIELVIFDLDGVIVSTDEFHYHAWKSMADKENIYFDRTINHRLRGVDRATSLNIILEKADKVYSKVEKEKLMALKNKMYVESLEGLSPSDVYPNVLNTLYNLKKKNIKIAIGSSSKNAKKILEKIELLNTFDYISDGNGIKRGKPFPDVFLNASNQLNIKPVNCMVIEDAKAGIDAAKNAGMVAVGISDAASYDKADASLSKIGDLIDLIAQY